MQKGQKKILYLFIKNLKTYLPTLDFQTNPLLKKKGIPECILFVTQRLTKYPLLVEPLIKTSTTTEETSNLREALALVKEILGDVDACVADKEREDRKLEIYNR